METIWIFAGSRHSASQALRKNLGASFDEEQFVAYRYIATADMIGSNDGERFLVVRDWKRHPEADEILQVLKEAGWRFVPFKDLLLG